MTRLTVVRVLCLWLPLLVASALARPKGQGTAVTLDITSSVRQGQPLFRDNLASYTKGEDLTLTCSTSDPTVTLTWWEGKKKLKAEPQRSQEMSSTFLTLERILVSDSSRKLSCKATEAGVVKTITLKVGRANALDIVVDDKALRHDDPTITAHAGATVKLTCISRGYSSSSTSWFVDNTELESKIWKSLHASSNVLTIPDITTKDTGRRFSCRSEGTEPDRTVELLVYRDETVDHGRDHHGDDARDNTDKILGIVLTFVAIGTVMIITISAGIMYLFKAGNEVTRVKPKVNSNKLFKKYTLFPSGFTSKNNYKVISPSLTNI